MDFDPLLQVLRVLISLALVLGLGYYGLKFLGSHRGVGAGRERRIRIIESVPLGQRRLLLLLSVKDEEFLLGSSESGISLLGHWKAEEVTPPETPGLE
ncbi:MAG TPA: FliO/MopB family protein [Clostridia bacterium]|nr:FliO/MopB family protein [Clostridia bacterium]